MTDGVVDWPGISHLIMITALSGLHDLIYTFQVTGPSAHWGKTLINSHHLITPREPHSALCPCKHTTH